MVHYPVVEPMNVFRFAVMKGSVKIIMVHNHPSGELTPSEADKDLMDKLIQVGIILNIVVEDHLIISDQSYFSFNDNGIMNKLRSSTKFIPHYILIESIRKEETEIREKAIKANLLKGKKEGKKEEKKEKAVEVAKNSLKEGLSIELIIKLTGLTKKEIKNLETE